MTPSTKRLREQLRWCHLTGQALGGMCVWDVRGSGAFVCGYWCANKHVCVPTCVTVYTCVLYVCMFSEYVLCENTIACVCTC